jgi:hypothetical protein
MAKKCIENKPECGINAGQYELRWLANKENALGELEGGK